MIRHLSRNHSVVIASLAHTEQELAEGSGLKDYCEEVIAEILPNSMRWSRAFKAVLASTPSSVAYFWSSRLYRRIRERLLTTDFDVIFVHCAFVAQYVKDYEYGFKVLDFGDLDSAKWAQYSRWKRFPFSVGYAVEAAKLRRYERDIARRFNRCSVTTQGEMEEFHKLGVTTSCRLIPNGVDTEYFTPDRWNSASSRVIVFLGRMDYFPNIDGVNYFVKEIFPIIREKREDAELRIIGSNPAKSVRELRKLPNISVTGHVRDVRPYLKDAAVSIAPLRIARGTQNKILESMAFGIPVVATPEASKGVQAIHGRDLLVADNSQSFAQKVLDLMMNRQLAIVLSEAGRRQVERAHRWSTSMNILDNLLAEASARPRACSPQGNSSRR